MEETYKSDLTMQEWKLIPCKNGYVAVCDALSLSTEGDCFEDTLVMISDCEILLMDELADERMTITEYIGIIKDEKTIFP